MSELKTPASKERKAGSAKLPFRKLLFWFLGLALVALLLFFAALYFVHQALNEKPYISFYGPEKRYGLSYETFWQDTSKALDDKHFENEKQGSAFVKNIDAYQLVGDKLFLYSPENIFTVLDIQTGEIRQYADDWRESRSSPKLLRARYGKDYVQLADMEEFDLEERVWLNQLKEEYEHMQKKKAERRAERKKERESKQDKK